MAMGLEGTQSGALFVAEGLKGGGSLCPILHKLLLRFRDAILCLFSLMFERIHARVVLCSWGGLHREVDAQQAVAIGASDACLLYTSPSPRDKRQSRMPSSA